MLLALISVPLLLLRGRGSIHRLVALAPRSARLVEPRLTGGFPWAAYAGVHRAAGESKDAAQLKLGGAAGEIVEGAARNSDREAQHAAGVALVLVQEPAEAVTRLEAAAGQSREAPSGQSREAAAGQTNDPKVLSDLAAARYAAASQLGRASLYPTALAAADAALRLDPNLSEALFNRALTLDRLGLAFDARRAWQRYLQADGSSAWAVEAQARLAQLPATTHKAQFEHDRPLLEQAAARGDAAAVRRYVDANRELARRYAEPIYLGHWGEAVQRNEMAEAARLLSISRGVGSALFAISGDALLRDAVHAIDTATPAGQQAIAAAHVLYLSGRTAYSRDQRDTAERDLLRAAAAFEAARDPMALQAQYYAASVRLAGNDTAGARADLERMLAAAGAHRDYISFGAYVRWDLGRALSADDDWSGAAAVLAEGAAMLQQVGEREGEAFVETNLANALSSLGRNDDAWLARMRAFSALSAEGINPQRLATAIAAAAAGELAAGHRDAALALMSTEASVAPDAGRPQMAISGLVTRAMLQSMNGDPSAAAQTARQADALAQQTSDPALRASWTATAGVARGAVLAAQDPRAAAEPLTRSIDFYASHATPGALLDPLLLRSRCAVRTGDVPSAMRDLEQGM
ncbi:MAG TPA: hypothetical protein VFA35_06415, partial [Burkholderiaceae bacterium]|nr:hypothetical protein [Burkholderiaceae bacterium]